MRQEKNFQQPLFREFTFQMKHLLNSSPQNWESRELMKIEHSYKYQDNIPENEAEILSQQT